MPLLAIVRRALLQASTSLRLVGVLYVINLIFAGVIALGFRYAISSPAGVASLAPLMNGFDFTVVSDYMHTRGDGVRTVMQMALIMTAVSAVANGVMAGGILTHLRDGGPFSLRAFLAGCGAYAMRFIGLMAIMGAVVIGLLAVLLGLTGSLAAAMSVDATSENVMIAWTSAGVIVTALVLVLVLMTVDYARVMMVHSDARSLLRTLGGSSRFVLGNIFSVAGLQVLMTALAGACIVVYLSAEPFLPATPGVAMLLLVLLQQLSVAARIWARVAFFAGELGLYVARRPADVRESLSTFAGA